MEKDDRSKSVFDLRPEEMQERFRNRLEELQKEVFDKGLPITYQDGRCPTDDHFIREYADGRLHLTLFDGEKREFAFVKDLTNG